MACSTNKFIINKGIDNEFLVTIKQTGTTLPMEIVTDDAIIKYTTADLGYEYIGYQAAIEPIEAQDAVTAVVGVCAVAYVPEQPETYRALLGSLPDTGTASETYNIYINNNSSETISIDYSSDPSHAAYYSEDITFMLEVADRINNVINSGSGSAIVDAHLDENKLVLVGKPGIGHYTVNSSNIFSLYQTSTYSAAIDAIEYVAPVEAQDAREFVAGSDEVVAGYKYTTENIVLDLEDIVENYSVVGIRIKLDKPISSVDVGSYSDGWYDIGVNTSVTITPAADSTKYGTYAELSKLVVEIELTVDNIIDTFDAKLYKKSDDSLVLDSEIVTTIDSAMDGRIKLSISGTNTENLEAEKGRAEDRYYLKPLYRLIVNCATTNNDKFVAKINNVYVE